MWRSYLTVAIRSMTRNRVYSAINIFGLAIGMAACLIILLYVRYEHSYDAWLPGSDDVYQVQTYYKEPTIGEMQASAYVAKTYLTKDFPQVSAAVFINAGGGGATVIKDGISYESPDAAFVDSNPIKVLELPFVVGNPKTALEQVDSAVLTQTEAKRWFGNANPIGKTITIAYKKGTRDFRVTGIVHDFPKNSQFKISMLLRWNIFSAFSEFPDMLTHMGINNGLLYIRLKPGSDIHQITSQIPAWKKRNIKDDDLGGQKLNWGDIGDVGIVNVRDVHLGSAQKGAMTPGNSITTVNTFAAIALMILAIGCVNFVNLATARASQRAREVAIRKVLGANRRQLVIQFIGESLLMASVAMLLGLALTELFLPAINVFLDAEMQLHYWGSDGMALPIIVLVLIVGAAGGIYPGIYLSRFQPAHVLKANKSAADPQGSGRLRAALVIGQFAISIGLMICTAVIYGQTIFARTSNPGFNRDNILQVNNMAYAEYLHANSDTLAREFGKIEGVRSVGRTTRGIGMSSNNNDVVRKPGQIIGSLKSQPVIARQKVDPAFFPTMGINLIAGRNFDPSRPMDDASTPFPEDLIAERALVARGINVVLNSFATRTLGFKRPEDAIGQRIDTTTNPKYGGWLPATIIGVVGDTRLGSIREPLDPTIYIYHKRFVPFAVVRYSGDPSVIREKVEQVWKRLAPDVPFKAEFSEDIVAKQYQVEQARAQIFAAFSILAVVIGCLGLFGLAAFTTERRTREIGIRKVLGASTRQIVRLLVWQFSRPVLIANLIAWPIAWWVMRDWLNGFDARIALTPVPFVGAGLLALAIAVGTIAAHSIRVARTNPIHALRYE